MPVQWEYIQLIADRANAARLSNGIFTILISVTQAKNVEHSLPLHEFHQNWQTVM